MAHAKPQAGKLHVDVAYSPAPRQVDLTHLVLPEGSTVLHALRVSRVLERHPEIDLGTQRVGIWGRAAALSQVLREADRVEIYRALQVDPKEARRLRYTTHVQQKKQRAQRG